MRRRVDLLFIFDRHVGNGDPIFRNDGRQLKARAKARLVPARKESARIGSFKLGAEHDLLRTAPLLLIRHKE